MSMIEQLRQQAAAAAAVAQDMTEEQKGGGGRLIPAGTTLAYLCEVIEFGEQPQEYDGKPKAPARDFQLGFQLLNPNMANEDGTCPVIRTFDLPETRSAKSKAFKLFKNMNWRSDHSRFAQMIGEMFILTVVHVTNQKTKKVSARIDMDSVRAPLDAATGGVYAAPADRPLDEKLLRMFLWDVPSLEGWKSIHIDGTWDDGESKNKLQEKCLLALDFEGSALQNLLFANNVPYQIPVRKDKTEAAIPDAAGGAEAATPDVGTAEVAPAPVQPAQAAVAPVATPAAAPIPLAEVPFTPDADPALPVQ